MCPLKLPQSAPKAPGSFDRCFPLAHTVAHIPLLRERYAITRVADTTYLDRTYIPTFSAIVPSSDDLLSTYNGKGFTREASLCSAVMEAVERQLGAAPNLPTFALSTRDVQASIDLEKLEIRADARNAVVECVAGTDLLSGADVPVPLSMVQCPWYGKPLFRVTSTNGLASGNNLTEAIYHALCELIERHVWSLYHAKSHILPRLYFGEHSHDMAFAREVLFPSGDPLVDTLVQDVARAGLRLRVLSLEEPPLPPTMTATIIEEDAGMAFSHMGFGCSLSPSHALTRAVTEAVQSRVVDIQSAREDITRADDTSTLMGTHGRRQKTLPYGAWHFDLPCKPVELSSLPSRATNDLAEDLRIVLDSLRVSGASVVAAVDLSPPDVPINVVRIIVPELETTMINGRIGPKAMAIFNPFVAE